MGYCYKCGISCKLFIVKTVINISVTFDKNILRFYPIFVHEIYCIHSVSFVLSGESIKFFSQFCHYEFLCLHNWFPSNIWTLASFSMCSGRSTVITNYILMHKLSLHTMLELKFETQAWSPTPDWHAHFHMFALKVTWPQHRSYVGINFLVPC